MNGVGAADHIGKKTMGPCVDRSEAQSWWIAVGRELTVAPQLALTRIASGWIAATEIGAVAVEFVVGKDQLPITAVGDVFVAVGRACLEQHAALVATSTQVFHQVGAGSGVPGLKRSVETAHQRKAAQGCGGLQSAWSVHNCDRKFVALELITEPQAACLVELEKDVPLLGFAVPGDASQARAFRLISFFKPAAEAHGVEEQLATDGEVDHVLSSGNLELKAQQVAIGSSRFKTAAWLRRVKG